MIDILIKFILTMIRNPRFEAIALVGITSYIKKIMSEQEKNKIYLDDEVEQMIAVEQPLWMPAGSVRALITLVFVLASCSSFVWPEVVKIPEEFHALTVGAVAYYIGYRATK